MRITKLIADMNYATERALELRLLGQMGLADRMPASYAEFRLMTAVRSPVRRRGILASVLRRWS